jgi:hypothetical protein
MTDFLMSASFAGGMPEDRPGHSMLIRISHVPTLNGKGASSYTLFKHVEYLAKFLPAPLRGIIFPLYISAPSPRGAVV